MKKTRSETRGILGRFPYPDEWLDAGSDEIAKSIAKWADSEVIAKRLEAREDFAHQMKVFKILASDIGLHKLIWPEDIGGVGLSVPGAASTLARAYEEVGRADPGIAFVSAMNLSLAAVLIEDKKTSPALKRDIGSALCNGDELKLFSLVLPGLGDVDRGPLKMLSGREVQAEMKKDKDMWVLNARHVRPLNSAYDAYMYAVIAGTPDGFGLAFVKGGTTGVKRGEILKTTGLSASRSADIDFTNVKVSPDHVIPIDEDTYNRLIAWIDLLSGAIAVGSGMDVYNIVRDWADNRMIKGKGLLKNNPLDAAVLAQVSMDIINSRLLVHNLARAIAKPRAFGLKGGYDLFVLAESVLVGVLDTCNHAINRAMELMGSAGYSKEWNVEKHWRDLKTMQVYLGGRTPFEMDVARAYYGSSGI